MNETKVSFPLKWFIVIGCVFLLFLAGVWFGWRMRGREDVSDNRDAAERVRESISSSIEHQQRALESVGRVEQGLERSIGDIREIESGIEISTREIEEIGDAINRVKARNELCEELVGRGQSAARGGLEIIQGIREAKQ